MIGEVSCIKGYLPFSNHIFAIALVTTFAILLFNPVDIFYRDARIKFYTILFQNILSPFTNVKFKNFLLSEILSSLIIPMRDLVSLGCYIAHNPDVENGADVIEGCQNYRLINFCITIIPFYFRFMQCIRMII